MILFGDFSRCLRDMIQFDQNRGFKDLFYEKALSIN